MEKVNSDAIAFLLQLMEGQYDVSDFIKKISHAISFDINKIDIKVLVEISTLLNIESEMLTIVDGVQSMQTITMGQLLLKISEKDCHNVDEYKCIFHTESLICHLLFAMLKSLESLPSDMPKREKVHNAFTALVHDVGKFGCIAKLKFGKSLTTAFPFHGEHGSGILLKMWNDGYGPWFTKDEWETMCRTVAVHMCGYHETTLDSENAKYKLPLLRFETPQVKNMLYWLSYADRSGAVPEPHAHEDHEEYLKFRDTFKAEIMKPFDLQEFKSKYGLRGTIIEICGMSASGKSTLAEKLLEYLGQKIDKSAIVYVERDQIMSDIVSRRLGKGPMEQKASGNLYQELYEYYRNKNLASVVNQKMNKLISDGIRKGQIVIVDTVANYFNGADSMYPEFAINAFRIAIDVLRNKEITNEGDRLGMTLDEQLKIFGNVDFLNWIPDGAKPLTIGTGRLGMLASISSASSRVEQICKSVKDRVRPHFRFPSTWDSKNFAFWQMIDHIIATMEYTGKLSEDDMDACQLLDYLSSIGSWEQTRDFFGWRMFRSPPPALMQGTEYEQKSFLIKYLDQCRLYRPVWARQCRGSAFLRINDKFTCIKSLLQRGVEYLTHTHHNAGIVENENLKIGEYDHLDDIQQEIMRKFQKREKIDAIASSKNDGSLSAWGLFPLNNPETTILVDLITKSTDERDNLSRMIVKMAQDCNLPFIPILASQGTLTMTDLMIPYNVTAMCGMLGHKQEEITEMAKSGKTPIDVMESLVVKPIFGSLLQFWKNCPVHVQNETMWLSFEAIVAGRTDSWSNFHPELAISYDEPSYNFLGCTFMVGKNTGKYRTHAQIPSLIKGTGFKEPYWWKIKHTKMVESMITCLDNIIKGNMTEAEFLQKHPPANEDCGAVIDLEGIVLFTHIENSDSIGLPDADLDFDVDYGKVKTEGYYGGHKFFESKLPNLLALPKEIGKRIPLVGAVHEFYIDLQKNIDVACDELKQIIDKIHDANHDVYHDAVNDNPKIQNAFQKASTYAAKVRIIVFNSPLWKDVCFKYFKESFKSLPDDDDTHLVLKGLISTIKPWEDGYHDRIAELVVTRNEQLHKLFNAVLKGQNIILT